MIWRKEPTSFLAIELMQGIIMQHQDQLEDRIVQSVNLTILVTRVFLLLFFRFKSITFILVAN